MVQIGSLFASLTLQSANFDSGLKKAVHSAEHASHSIVHSFKHIAEGAAKVFLGIELANITHQLMEFGKEAIEQAGHLGVLAAKTGTTVEQYQILQREAIASGVSIEAMNKGLMRLNKTVGDAKRGNEEAIKAFHALGITDEQIRSFHNAGDAYKDVAEGFKKSSDQAVAGSKAAKLLSRAYGEMAPMLKKGAEGYDENAAAAEKAGLITEEQAHKAHEAEAAMGLLAWTLKQKVAIAIVDNIDVIKQLVDWIGEMIDAVARGLRQLEVFSIKVAKVINQEQTGEDAVAAFLSTPNPIEGYHRAQQSNARHRAIRDNLDREQSNLEQPDVNDALYRRFHHGKGEHEGGEGGPVAQDLAHHRGGGRAHHARTRSGGRSAVDDTAKNLIAELAFENSQINLNSREQEINRRLREAGSKATKAQLAEIKKLAGEGYDTKALKEYDDWLKEINKDLAKQTRQIGMSDRDKAIDDMTQDFIDQWNKGHPNDKAGPGMITVTGVQLSQNAEYLDLLRQQNEYWDKYEKHELDIEAANKALEKQQQEWEEVQQAAEQFGEELGTISTDFFRGMIDGTKSWKQSFADAIESLARLLLEELVYKPIQEFIKEWAKAKATQGGGDFLSKLFGHIAGSSGGDDGWGEDGQGYIQGGFDDITPMGDAQGGDFNSGQPLLVGENGPEYIRPLFSGHVVPNSEARLGGGAITINVDARGATNVAETKRVVQEAIAAATPSIVSMSQGKTTRSLTRRRMPT